MKTEVHEGSNNRASNGPVMEATERGEIDAQTEAPTELPEIWVSGNVTGLLSKTSKESGEVLDNTGKVFRLRHGRPVEVIGNGKAQLKVIDETRFICLLEQVAQPVSVKFVNGKPVTTPKICQSRFAKLVLQQDAFLSKLTPIDVSSSCPLLVNDQGSLVVVHGGNIVNGVYAEGEAPIVPATIAEARAILMQPMQDFRFSRPSDKSKALSLFYAPLLAMGGLFHGRVPLFWTEADQPQSGKGFINKLARAIYGHQAGIINSNPGGLGSIGESLDSSLVNGKTFIQWDNLRGKADSQKLESLMSESPYQARLAHKGYIEIDPSRRIFSATTNGAEMTPDLAKRSLPIRLRKRDIRDLTLSCDD